MRFSFVGPMLDLMPLEIIPVVTDFTYQQYFWYSGDICETKEWPKSIPNWNIPVFSEYSFRLAELLFGG